MNTNACHQPTAIFTDKALAKAHELVDKGAIELAAAPNVFYVPSTKGPDWFYRVTIRYAGPVAREVTCTCPHGRRRVSPTQTVCTHATAALLHVLHNQKDGQESLFDFRSH